MSLAPGTRLGPYEVITAIGAGGMGEVYRARDTKLRRDVALKILPDAFALDLDRLARFEREAHVLASLNHPNIAHIYGLEDADGTHALVMELVEGPTLADRIARGALPLDEALPIAKQIVDALEAAHEQGIIHRDLKPANVKVKEDGTVKVLDFGLAKALDPTPSADRADSPTVTSPAMTQQGVILGTAAYMSPEQARGKPVDRRADIWAFGVVLYEMLTGRRLFPGDTVTDILAAVLERQPDLNHVPARTRPLFRRCLEKDPKRRLRDIGDALALLDEVPETVRVSRPWLAWGIAGLLAATLVPIALIHLGEDPPAPEMTRFAITLPENTRFTQDGVLSLSPDGRMLVFAATGSDGVSRLWLRTLNSLEARPLTSTESADPPAPFWSPDSKTLAFYSGGKLRKLDLASGSAQEICDLGYQGFGGAWSLQGIILVGGGPSGGIMRVPAAGGVPVKVTTADSSRQELHHELPIFLPDGRSFLYFRHSTTPGNSGMYLGSLEATPEQQRGEPLLATEFSAAYVPSSEPGTGQLLFLRGDTLFAQTFDARPKELTGDPVAVTSSLSLAVPSYGLFTASTGVLVYRAAVHQDRQLTWYDRRGVRLAALGEPGRYTSLAVSPDGTRVAVSQQNPTGGQDIYLIAVSSGTSTRLTSDPGSESQPVWSTDGSRIAFHLNRSGAEGFYQVPSTGGRTDLLLRLDRTATLTDWSEDGRLVYWQPAPTEQQHLWLLPVAGRREPIAFFSAPSRAIQGRLSPDGRWIAYLTNDSGGPEVFVQATHPPAEKAAAGADRWIVSGGANAPIGWRNDSRELFYAALDGGIMAVQAIPDPVFQAMPPIKLFQVPVGTLPPVASPERVIDVTPTGQRFLVAVPVASSVRPEFTVVLNWEAALKR